MLKSKRVNPRIYEVQHDGRTFHIDGQVHEEDSREWQLFEVTGSGLTERYEWIETYPTKRDALLDIPELTFDH